MLIKLQIVLLKMDVLLATTTTILRTHAFLTVMMGIMKAPVVFVNHAKMDAFCVMALDLQPVRSVDLTQPIVQSSTKE